MKRFLRSLRISVLAMILITVFLGIGYPLCMFCIGQLFFHKEANGTILYKNGQAIGSKLIGQNFTDSQYFHPRPSAAGSGYDPTSSSGSNLGPTAQKLVQGVAALAVAYRKDNNLDAAQKVPADAVTASGSGLDPHISPMNAHLQAPRVASARGLSERDVEKLIKKHTRGPALGLFGESRVNVLLLNLELDKVAQNK